MENNNELNQGLTEVQEVPNEKNPFLSEAKKPCIKSACQKLLNMNPKSWKDLEDKGIIPLSGTYEEYINIIFKHYQMKNEVALERVRLNAEKETEKKSSKAPDGDFTKISIAAMVQRIKLDKARERGIHIANLKESKQIIDKNELLVLLSPFFGNIAAVLRNAADTEPTLQPVIDSCFQSLYVTGKNILFQCDRDSDAYVEAMINQEIDLNSLLEE